MIITFQLRVVMGRPKKDSRPAYRTGRRALLAGMTERGDVQGFCHSGLSGIFLVVAPLTERIQEVP